MSIHRHSETLADLAHMLVARALMKLGPSMANTPEDRPAYDELLSKLPTAEGVTYAPDTVGGVSGWWCHPEQRSGSVLLHLHGGAYVMGTALAYRHFVGQIARRAGASAFIPDYALAPERPFPQAFDDCVAVYLALAKDADSIGIVGDSAGGGLALGLLSHIAHDPYFSQGLQPCAAVLMSPWTDLTLSGESITARADHDPMLTRAILADAASRYLDGAPSNDLRGSTLLGDLSGLPSLLIHVGEDEILLDDSVRVERAVSDAGGYVELHIWEGMIHVFPASFADLHAAAEALDHVGSFLAQGLLQGRSPP